MLSKIIFYTLSQKDHMPTQTIVIKQHYDEAYNKIYNLNYNVIYDKAYNETLHQKLESIQYNTCLLAKLGAIRGSSREKFYLELGLESLQC